MKPAPPAFDDKRTSVDNSTPVIYVSLTPYFSYSIIVKLKSDTQCESK